MQKKIFFKNFRLLKKKDNLKILRFVMFFGYFVFIMISGFFTFYFFLKIFKIFKILIFCRVLGLKKSDFFVLFSKFLRLILNITEVTTEHQRWPKISTNSMKNSVPSSFSYRILQLAVKIIDIFVNNYLCTTFNWAS